MVYGQRFVSSRLVSSKETPSKVRTVQEFYKRSEKGELGSRLMGHYKEVFRSKGLARVL